MRACVQGGVLCVCQDPAEALSGVRLSVFCPAPAPLSLHSPWLSSEARPGPSPDPCPQARARGTLGFGQGVLFSLRALPWVLPQEAGPG